MFLYRSLTEQWCEISRTLENSDTGSIVRVRTRVDFLPLPKERSPIVRGGEPVYGGPEIPDNPTLARTIGGIFKPNSIDIAIKVALQKLTNTDSIQEKLSLLVKTRVLTWEQVKAFFHARLVWTLEPLLPYPSEISVQSGANFDVRIPGISRAKIIADIERRKAEWALLAPTIPSMEAIPYLPEGSTVDDPKVAEHLRQWVDGQRSLVDNAEKVIVSPEKAEKFNEIKSLSRDIAIFLEQMATKVQSGNPDAAIQQYLTRRGIQMIRRLENLTTEFSDAEQKIIDETNREAEAASQFLSVAYGLATLLSIAIGLLSAYAIASGIAKTLKEAADKVTASSSLISSTVEQQERIFIEQAASVNETSSTIDRSGYVSLQSAQQAEESAEGARRALNLAEEGTKSVEETMETMAKLKERIEAIARQIVTLSEQTTQIDKVSSLVGDLANQTNTLALNAAVEASRAGESGKGFGVVATEIRKLADESKKSAAKINTLINDIQSAMNSTDGRGNENRRREYPTGAGNRERVLGGIGSDR